MGGCCSKCDEYLLGGQTGTKSAGDTPKLARVSHSDSFRKEKGESGELSKNLINKFTADDPPISQRLEEKLGNGDTSEHKYQESKQIPKVTPDEVSNKEVTKPVESSDGDSNEKAQNPPDEQGSERKAETSVPSASKNINQKPVPLSEENNDTVADKAGVDVLGSLKSEGKSSTHDLESETFVTSSAVAETLNVSERSTVETVSSRTTSVVESTASKSILSGSESALIKTNLDDFKPINVQEDSPDITTEQSSTKLTEESSSVVEKTSRTESSVVQTSIQSSSVFQSMSEGEYASPQPQSAMIAEIAANVDSTLLEHSSQSSSSLTKSVTKKESVNVCESASKTTESLISQSSESSSITETSAVHSSSTLQSSAISSETSGLPTLNEENGFNSVEEVPEEIRKQVDSLFSSGTGGDQITGLVDGSFEQNVSEHHFSSSKAESSKITSSTISSVEGSELVSKVEESSTSECMSSISAEKTLNGEVVSSQEQIEASKQQAVSSIVNQGDQVEESSAVLTESYGKGVKDGELVSSHQNTTYTENIPEQHRALDADKNEEALPPPPSADDFPSPHPSPPPSVDEFAAPHPPTPPSADEFPSPPPLSADEFPAPPPPVVEEVELPPPEGLETPPESRSSYALLVTPPGFVSQSREETDGKRRSFANSLLSDTAVEEEKELKRKSTSSTATADE